MSRKQLAQEMDSNEVRRWMAYEISCDPKVRERLEKELANERAKQLDIEANSEQIRNIFKELGHI